MCPMIDIGPLAPDQPDVRGVGCETAADVIPRASGYDSMPLLESAGAGSLNSAARGALTGRTRLGTNFTVAGSANRLYLGTTGSLANVSNGGGSPYTLTATDWWDFVLYGNRVIASSYADAPEDFVIGTDSAFGALSADAPRARHLAVVRDFVVAGNIIGRGANAATIGTAEDAVQWSALDDPTTWPQVGTAAAKAVQSDWQPLAGNGGEITDLTGGSDFGLVFRKRGIWRMDYEGGDTFFRFTPIEENLGCVIPKAAIRVGGLVYFPSEQGFYATDGFQTVPIGNEIVDRTFRDDLQDDTEQYVSCAYFPAWKCVVWAYMGEGATMATPNRLLLYNVIDNRWATASKTLEWLTDVMPFTESLDSYVDSLDSGALSAVNLDSLIAASKRTAGAFNTSHELATFTAAAGTAVIQTSEFEPAPGRVALLKSVRPVFDVPPANGLAAHSRVRMRSSDAPVQSSGATEDATGKHPMRATGRYVGVRFVMDGAFSGFSGFDADYDAKGAR